MNFNNKKITPIKVTLLLFICYLLIFFIDKSYQTGANTNMTAGAHAAGTILAMMFLAAIFVFLPMYIKKSQYTNIGLVIAVFALSIISILGNKGYKVTDLSSLFLGSYNDCILEHSQSLDTLVAANMVKKSCREKYPLKLIAINKSDVDLLTGSAEIHQNKQSNSLATFNADQYRFKSGSINIEITNPNHSFFIKQFVLGFVDPHDDSNYQEIFVDIPERDEGNKYYLNVESKFKYEKSDDINWFIKSASAYNL